MKVKVTHAIEMSARLAEEGHAMLAGFAAANPKERFRIELSEFAYTDCRVAGVRSGALTGDLAVVMLCEEHSGGSIGLFNEAQALETVAEATLKGGDDVEVAPETVEDRDKRIGWEMQGRIVRWLETINAPAHVVENLRNDTWRSEIKS